MESSTASTVDPSSPSRFRYRERHGVIWGGYEGDTVTFGRFVGTRVGNDLAVQFVHVLAASEDIVSGSGSSTVESGPDGRIRLVENFAVGDVEHLSVCVEAD